MRRRPGETDGSTGCGMSERTPCECGAIEAGAQWAEAGRKMRPLGARARHRRSAIRKGFRMLPDPVRFLEVLLGLGRPEQPQAHQCLGAQLRVLLLIGDPNQLVLRPCVE